MFPPRFAVAAALIALPSVDCSSKDNLLDSNWKKATVAYSQGGNAICLSGNVPIPVKATTTKLLLPRPSGQEDVTQIFPELLEISSTIIATNYGGTFTINQIFQIDATYSVPRSHSCVKTLQILTHDCPGLSGCGDTTWSRIIDLLAQNAKYPKDVNGTALTGFVDYVASLSYNIAVNNPAVAAIKNPKSWRKLPYVHDTAISIQVPFFRAPYFPLSTSQRQTYTVGRQFTLPAIYPTPPNFTGPADLGTAATIPVLYSAVNSKSESFIVPEFGHIINANYEADAQFDQINGFLDKNRILRRLIPLRTSLPMDSKSGS
ncbi:hypothetical protein DSL72_000475 [Monilinia vaccinii-corymbosi]|uniref:Uncharacterized protein n=1 Tax=Monilinia vaccinii-corymbosi TaxID=61207 RepID=A0A8A3PAC0_9HELO|nr:hypothetical protein DSL72_000475 [Monilinia vaccinii-corymbosi]